MNWNFCAFGSHSEIGGRFNESDLKISDIERRNSILKKRVGLKLSEDKRKRNIMGKMASITIVRTLQADDFSFLLILGSRRKQN